MESLPIVVIRDTGVLPTLSKNMRPPGMLGNIRACLV